jgi:hypothetical protein
MLFDLLRFKNILHVKTKLFATLKSYKVFRFAWIRIDLAPSIRIRICIEIKSWIRNRISIEIYADPKTD